MILKIFLVIPLVLVFLAFSRFGGGHKRLAPEDETKARSNIVPLDVRDPSALVMAPFSSGYKCAGPCPSVEKVK